MTRPRSTRTARRVALLDVALVVAFVLLGLAVARGWQPAGLDRAVVGSLPSGGLLLRVAGAVTALADPPATAAGTLLVGVAVARARRSPAVLRLVVVRVAALAVTVVAAKAVVQRPGPLEPAVDRLHGYFPSGHTAAALVCSCTLAGLLATYRPAWRTRAYGVAAVWTVLVAVGLVLHRYHWPSDVVGSALLGTLLLRWAPHPGDLVLQPVDSARPGAPRGTIGHGGGGGA